MYFIFSCPAGLVDKEVNVPRRTYGDPPLARFSGKLGKP